MALVTPARSAASRMAPLAIGVLVLAVGLAGGQIARVGFDLLQPESFLEEEIAQDPTSPIAVAHEIARKNRVVPGTTAAASRVLFLLPVLLLVVLDPRRRPRLATLGWALGLFAVSAVTLARAPAFAAAVPGAGAMAAGLALTLLAGWLGALAAIWLGTALSTGRLPVGA